MTIFHYSPHMECVGVLRMGYTSWGRYRLHPYIRLITMHFIGTVRSNLRSARIIEKSLLTKILIFLFSDRPHSDSVASHGTARYASHGSKGLIDPHRRARVSALLYDHASKP